MKWSMASAAILVAVLSSVTGHAQSGGTMARGDKMDEMEMKDTSYTGCIEAGSGGDTWTLTNLSVADRMGKDAMKKDSMKHDTMAKDNMGDDSKVPTALHCRGSRRRIRK